jgi:hypothetical protein
MFNQRNNNGEICKKMEIFIDKTALLLYTEQQPEMIEFQARA